MRLFTAIMMEGEAQLKISNLISRIKNVSKSGNFTVTENLHTTLNFLGDVDPNLVGVVKMCMDSITTRAFDMSVSFAGRFDSEFPNERRRKDPDEYMLWLGVEKSETLSGLQRDLVNVFDACGIPFDKKDFLPHITLGRRVISDFDQVTGMAEECSGVIQHVSHISLMNSEVIDGHLTYIEIYRKNLKTDI